MNWKES